MGLVQPVAWRIEPGSAPPFSKEDSGMAGPPQQVRWEPLTAWRRYTGSPWSPLPQDIRSMSPSERYDAIVIGAGQAGGPLATALARSGKRTALIEREHVGGTCINEGCTPTKTMVASARVAHLARRGVGYGVETGPIRVDMGRVRERKRAIVKS